MDFGFFLDIVPKILVDEIPGEFWELHCKYFMGLVLTHELYCRVVQQCFSFQTCCLSVRTGSNYVEYLLVHTFSMSSICIDGQVSLQSM